MATTTNYGWTTPDDTALVKDGAAAIRTLGSSVDTTTKNLNPETTLGDIAYRSSTANVKTRLGLGTAGQLLAVNSGATAPEWVNVPSSIPANSNASVATSQGTTSASYTDLATSGPAVTVTTGTKALVIVTCDLTTYSNYQGWMSYAVSGATTTSASDTVSLSSRVNASATTRASAASVATLTAGSNTFTAKYRVDSGNSGVPLFENRQIFVINLA
jgi:hypothetical protein